MHEWIPCEQQLPPNGVDVLVWTGRIMTIARLMRDEGGDYWESDDDVADLFSPTHWMAIQPPGQTSGKNGAS